MKAIAIVPGTRQIRLGDFEEPHIQKPDEIKVKVLSVGICGTDREEVAGGRSAAPSGEKELIIGHEMLSQVIEIGKGVKSVQVGDLVVITVRRGCGACPACKMERSDMCLTGNYTEHGIKGLHGFQATYVVDRECFAVKVPKEIAHIGVLAEPMAVVKKAIREVEMIQETRLPYVPKGNKWLPTTTALVAGLGPIGLLAALILRLRGAKVFGLDVVDSQSPRVSILEAMGGTYINEKKTNLADFAKNHPPVDFILDAAGVAALDFDLLDILGVNGVFVLTGVPGEQHALTVNGAGLMRKLVLKNQILMGSVNESIKHFELGIEDLGLAEKKWPGITEKIITQTYSYKDFEKAFTRTPGEIKVVIQWTD